MGTLTSGQPRLDSYCVHKLPTSCRLSSIPECCACADERAHAAAYSTYIDGVGYVLRGSRWQRYCWFCKEFWENRIRASGLPASQTRIPDNPDQTAFLDRWYEFHQGYRIVTKEDGTEERIAVLGEDMRDVSPGCMPRTIQEVRDDRQMSAFESSEVSARVTTAIAPVDGPSLDEELDRMFEDASAEHVTAEQIQEREAQNREVASIVRNNIASSMVAGRGHLVRNSEYQSRRIAALRRELQRLRNGIERVITGLRDLGEPVPDQGDATSRLAVLSRTLDDINSPAASTTPQESSTTLSNTERTTASMQHRVEQARQAMADARRMHDQAAIELESAEQEVHACQTRFLQLQREQRTTENYIRIFGTREDIIAQGDAYESPIGGMFNRAWERFRAAEDTRQEERTLRRFLEDEHATGGEEQMQRLAELETLDRDVWGVPQSQASAGSEPVPGIRHQGTSNTTQLMEMARDEVFAGQFTQSQDSTIEARSQESSQMTSDDRTAITNPANSYTLVETPYTLADSPHQTGSNLIMDAIFVVGRIEEHGLVTQFTRSHEQELSTATNVLFRHCEGYNVSAAEELAESILADDETIWAARLPSERFRRERETHHRILTLTANPTSDGREEQRQNIEAMAQAYMMSATVRRRSTLTAMEQLNTLYRLQRRERTAEDRHLLWSMLNTNEAVEAARQVLRQQATVQPAPEVAERLAALSVRRRVIANNMVTSREDLNRTRQAVAAQGSAALPPRDSQTQTWNVGRERFLVYQGGSSSESDEEVEEEALGLDAKDSGRPEPKEDAELTLKLECRICYSQVAEVACLPCGHLVMCRWCSDQHSPTMRHDKTRPRLPASCPVCRKNIKQKVRVYRA